MSGTYQYIFLMKKKLGLSRLIQVMEDYLIISNAIAAKLIKDHIHF